MEPTMNAGQAIALAVLAGLVMYLSAGAVLLGLLAVTS